jgi:para-aminobenzoate synthetase component 1
MLIYDKVQAISVMNELGAKGIPFVFLVDFEMKKIIISSKWKNNTQLKFEMNGLSSHEVPTIGSKPSYFESYPIPKAKYADQFQLVKSEIQRGNSFLLNLSFPTRIVTDLSLENIFDSSKAKYKVLLEDQFVCFSPETFIQISAGRITSFPMKGTIDANLPNAEKIILDDKKELAEHYTIVDLIRNDLSRVAKQVKVDRFRYIDKISTSRKDLFQVSSEISGILPYNYPSNIGSILFELLPAGSISGAPKSKTLEIIQEAEGQERGYYTGIFGHFDGVNLDSGVIIRYIEKVRDQLYYRSGGGITSMSELDMEYQEILDKVYLPFSENKPFIASQKHITRNGC